MDKEIQQQAEDARAHMSMTSPCDDSTDGSSSTRGVVGERTSAPSMVLEHQPLSAFDVFDSDDFTPRPEESGSVSNGGPRGGPAAPANGFQEDDIISNDGSDSSGVLSLEEMTLAAPAPALDAGGMKVAGGCGDDDDDGLTLEGMTLAAPAPAFDVGGMEMGGGAGTPTTAPPTAPPTAQWGEAVDDQHSASAGYDGGSGGDDDDDDGLTLEGMTLAAPAPAFDIGGMEMGGGAGTPTTAPPPLPVPPSVEAGDMNFDGLEVAPTMDFGGMEMGGGGATPTPVPVIDALMPGIDGEIVYSLTKGPRGFGINIDDRGVVIGFSGPDTPAERVRAFARTFRA